jgi:hypothetical protein
MELRIRFKGQKSELVNYRIKSTLYNGQKSLPGYLILGAGQSLTVQWSIVPTFEFRLTQKLNQTVSSFRYFRTLQFKFSGCCWHKFCG